MSAKVERVKTLINEITERAEELDRLNKTMTDDEAAEVLDFIDELEANRATAGEAN